MRGPIIPFAAAGLALLALLAGCEKKAPPPPVAFEPVAWSDLPGWHEDAVARARSALDRSCQRLLRRDPAKPMGPLPALGAAGDWQPACAALADVPAGDDAALRQWLREWFAPHAVLAEGAPEGLFTGYYEVEMPAARQSDARYSAPLYGVPEDLVIADLGAFLPELDGRRIVGRVDGRRLVPYPARAEIAQGALDGRAPVLFWADDPVNVLLLHIQGSGRLRLPDGEVVRVGFAASNGRPFVGIGRVLLDEGLIPPEKANMPAIAQWLRANPDKATELIRRNPRYIFFRRIDGDGPIGAQGVPLTPRRSLAVDTSVIPLGAPLWLDTTDPDGRPLRRLMVAQDTGAAIKGAVRGDFFWGAGDEAFRMAGRMKSRGRYFLLLPRPRAQQAELAKGGSAPHP